uniref:C2H2-type domain-containing protein n=1 Tax=Leptobrachium leishanense TaxID=445787 RepID=A0A8C5ME58_9ANUR
MMTERILDLTLEVNYLLTGEDYIVVKRCSEPDLQSSSPLASDVPCRTQSPGRKTSPHSLIHERNNDHKILEMTNKIIHLLTGEGRRIFRFLAPELVSLTVLTMTNKNRYQKTEKILDLTLEVNYLLTGEDYIVVKRSGEPILHSSCHSTPRGPCGSQKLPPPHSQIHGGSNEQKILQLTNKIIHLLTGEVWEYFEKHKEPSKDTAESRSLLDSLDDSLNRTEADVVHILDSSPDRTTEGDEDSINQTRDHYPMHRPTKRPTVPLKRNSASHEKRHVSNDDINRHNEQSQTRYSSTPIKEETTTCVIGSHTDIYPAAEHAQTKYLSTDVTEESNSCEEVNLPDMDIYTQANYPLTHIKEEPGSWDGGDFSDTDVYPHTDHTLTEYPSSHIKEELDLWNNGNLSDMVMLPHCYLTEMRAAGAGIAQQGKTMKLINQGNFAVGKTSNSFSISKASPITPDLTEHQKVQDGRKVSDGGENTSSEPNFLGQQSFHHNSHLLQPHRTFQGTKPLSCSECGKCFTKRRCLVQHQLVHMEELPLSCTECGKRFKLKRTLKAHLRSHTGEKPFSCSICSKRFNDKSSLNRHQRVHTGEKPFSCTECGKRFTWLPSLYIHMRSHTGEKPFTCTECGKCFRWLSSLNAHLRSHAGEKSFMCYDCGAFFTDKLNLIAHQITHAGGPAIQ